MTERESHDIQDHRIGDKIRIRSGPHRGQRGIVHAASGNLLNVQLDTGSNIQVTPDVITNYSRAARHAWEKMPKRAGRPKAGEPRKRMVSLRVDRDIWERLGRAVDQGLIASREQAVNDWIRDNLDRLL